MTADLKRIRVVLAEVSTADEIATGVLYCRLLPPFRKNPFAEYRCPRCNYITGHLRGCPGEQEKSI